VKAVIRPRAQDDILRQFRWYLVDQDAPDAAFRFVEAVEASVEQLLRMPNMGALTGIRSVINNKGFSRTRSTGSPSPTFRTWPTKE